MRIVERSAQLLVVREGGEAERLVGAAFAVGGFVFAGAGATQGQWLAAALGLAFLVIGVWMFARAPEIVHRFDRQRAKIIVTVSRTLRREEKQMRFAEVADIVMETRMQLDEDGREFPVYRLAFVDSFGRRMPWGEWSDTREDQDNCRRAVREFLGLSPDPKAAP